ncbi:MAG: YWFCY domain-containing protein, partial [Chitinophagaceae bacterium]|nr:YWFCY domain-containing protein [Chitinophagaceae bacterium]
MSGTGESDNDLRKILDLTRLLSVGLLLLHYYVSCYEAFENWGFTSSLTYRIIQQINATGLFENFHTTKLLSLLFLAVGLMGTQGKKDPSKSVQQVFILFLSGAVLFAGSIVFFYLSFSTTITALLYIITSVVGYLLLMQAGTLATRFMKTSNLDDIFNEENETFPQEERLLTSEYSINFKAEYRLRNKTRSSWINIINPFRGLLVTGTPGAGKSWFVILPAMKQMIEKGYAMFIYDFKYPDLSKPAYNWMLQYANQYGTKPSFYTINFDDLSTSNRCNPLDPALMHDITDATEASRIILLGLNREWIKKQGDFFVESAINFLACIIWYLRKYKDGKYCTLPHVLELMQAEYDDLLPLLNSEPEIEILVNPFIQAYQSVL